MDREHLTLLLIPDPSEPPRVVRVSRRIVRYATVSAAVVLSFLLVWSAALFIRVGDTINAARLQAENELLSANLDRMQERVDQLTRSLAGVAERDRRFRLLAGLPEIDPEVRQVGIGGPGTESIEREPLFKLDSGLGEQVFTANSDLNRLLRQANLLQVSMEEAARAMEGYREKLASTPSIDPVEGWLSSTFNSNRYHPLLNIRRPHEGIDISAWPGTPVVATADGQVDFAGWRPGFGYTVEIEHGDGIRTRYAHNQKNLKVRIGDRVRRGDVIAYVGATGIASGPHVHYEVIRDGRAVNPEDYRLKTVIVE